MRYKVSVLIEKDRDTVVRLIQNPELFKEWMHGLVDYKIIHKTEEGAGTKTELHFQGPKGRTSRMIEEVLELHVPEQIVTTYEAGGVYNRCNNNFYIEGEHTVYEMETIFEFGFFTKLYIWMFKSVFRKQTLSGMIAFKHFVERWEE